METYINWVNSQLKKRPRSRVVEDLQRDMRDGVAFLQLIEVIGDEDVNMIQTPVNLLEMTSNVTRVLKFMAERKIKMHQINTKEIVEGNLRAIMRLILALATHFKPASVRQTASNENQHGKLERASSTMSLAADAAVALADASQMASSGLSLHYKYRNRPNFDMGFETSDSNTSTPRLNPVHSRSSSSASNASQHSTGGKPPRGGTLPRTKQKKKYGDLTPSGLRSWKSGVSKLSFDSGIQEPTKGTDPNHQFDERTFRNRVSRRLLTGTKSEGGFSSRKSSRPSSAGSATSVDDRMLADEHDDMVMEVKQLKDYLLDLQQLLMEGEPPGGDNNNNDSTHPLSLDGAPLHEQVVMYKARLDQADKEFQAVKNTCSSLKEEVLKLNGEKTGLQDRLTQIEQAHIDLRSDQLRQELACDSARSAKDTAQRIIDERERQITSLHEEVARKDQLIQNQNREIEQLLATLAGRENTEADRDTELCRQELLEDNLRHQIEEITGRLEELGDTEVHMNSQIDMYHHRLSSYENSIARSLQPGEARREFEKVSITVKNLRSSFGKHDPRQHALDSVEQSLLVMMQGDSTDESFSRSSSTNNSFKKKSIQRMTSGRKLTESDLSSQGSAIKSNGIIDTPSIKKNKISTRTKVLYFQNQSITPYLGFINNSLGEIKLKDVKEMLDKPGNFRYFFKSLDPDFGSVREEIKSDEAIVPGWDEKIVAWIEEDRLGKNKFENNKCEPTALYVMHPNGTQEDLV